MGTGREVYVVTGAAGCLGRALVRTLHARHPNAHIAACVRAEPPAWLRVLPGVEVVSGDLCNEATWRRLPHDVGTLFHLAARIPRGDVPPAPNDRWANEQPVRHMVVQVPTWKRLRQVVYASSVAVYGDQPGPLAEDALTAPANAYAQAKLTSEKLLGELRESGVRVACLRYSSIYGQGMFSGTVVPVMLHAAAERGVISVYGRGQRQQDFVHAEDAALAAVLAAERAADGIFNVGSGQVTTMAALAEAIRESVSDGSAKVAFEEQKSEGPAGYTVDISKAQNLLGYAPRFSLRTGLARLCALGKG